MDITKTSLILIAVIVAILTFVLIVEPVSSDTSINAMVECCECECDCNTIFSQSSMPVCCSISDGSFPDCSLSNVPDNEAMLPSRTTLDLVVYNCQYVQSVSTEIDNGPNQLLEQKSSQLLPPHLYSEYHCRNSLNSEDPLL